MIDIAQIRELVEAAVAESFDEHLRALHDDVVARVLTSISPSIEAAAEPAVPAPSHVIGESTSDLNGAIVNIQQASQQVEILKNLLDGAAEFSARAALFILRGNVAVGWQARGFSDNDSIKAVLVDTGAGALGKVIHEYSAEIVSLAEFDGKFAASMGVALVDECVLMPLIVRGKVAAVLYADSGDEGVAADVCALELLTRAAGDWIELQALRKAAGAPAQYPIPEKKAERQPPVAVAVAASGDSTRTSEPTRGVEPPPAPVAAPMQAPVAVDAQSHAVPAPSEKVPAATPPVAVSAQPVTESVPLAPTGEPPAEDEELHKKARRFAKLLVDEIILYNQRKVMEGRQHHDLYERLKDDIEKSRATYDKRYAQTSVARNDYFTQAIIAGLADHNPNLLGGSFPR